MLNDVKGFSRVVIACGRTDLRCGIDGLAAIVQEQFDWLMHGMTVLPTIRDAKPKRLI